MTWPRYLAICAMWRETPPLHVSAAALAYRMGALEQKAQPRPAQAKAEGRDEKKAQRDDLIAHLAGKEGVRSGLPGWLKAARAKEQAGG